MTFLEQTGMNNMSHVYAKYISISLYSFSIQELHGLEHAKASAIKRKMFRGWNQKMNI